METGKFPYVVKGPGIMPMRTIEVRLERSSFPIFEREVGAFAHSFGFDDKSRQRSPDPQDTFFWMERSEVMLIGALDPADGPVHVIYRFGFYPQWDRPPPPAETVDGLVDGFKQSLAPLGRVTVTETTKAP